LRFAGVAREVEPPAQGGRVLDEDEFSPGLEPIAALPLA